MATTIHVSGNKNPLKLARDLQRLAKTVILVGIPSDTSARKEGEITNAEIGYFHENGVPSRNIPDRPHLIPGVRASEENTVSAFRDALDDAIDGNVGQAKKRMGIAGEKAVQSIRNVIEAGIAPPLSDKTLKASIRQGKGVDASLAELKSRKEGNAPGFLRVPLIRTGEYRNAITWVEYGND